MGRYNSVTTGQLRELMWGSLVLNSTRVRYNVGWQEINKYSNRGTYKYPLGGATFLRDESMNKGENNI